MEDLFVDTPAGQLHALALGAGPALVLLHSNGCSAHEFDPVLEPLARGRRVYALDLPGHGDSDPMTRHHSVGMHADAVVAFLDAVHVRHALVSGSSIGGLVALELTRAHRDRLTGASIVETPLRDEAFWASQWPRLEGNFARASQTADDLRPRFKDVTPQLVERWNIDRAKAGAKAMMDVMWAGRRFDALAAAAELGRSDLPQQLVIGTRGPIADLVDAWRKTLPSAELVLFEGCGHFPMLDEPARFAQVLGDFASRVEGST